ncbi:MAG: PAS-domain containing protein, partial [Alphaproteobacteria bacterium]
MEETFVDTLAIAGAIVSAQLAGFMYLSSRQGNGNPALVWWAAALSVEFIRLGIIAISSVVPGILVHIFIDGGHAPVALLMLAGCLTFAGNKPHLPAFLIGSLLTVAAIALGTIFRSATGLIDIALLAVATAAFVSMLWIFRSRQRTEGWYGYAAVTIPLLLTTAFFLGNTVSAINGFGIAGASAYDHQAYQWAGTWSTIGDLGLSLFTLTSLLIVAQQRENWASRTAAARIEASEQRFRDIAETAADWIWETGPDLRFSYFSDRLEQVTGLKPGNIIGKTRRDLLGGDPNEASWQSHLEDLDARRPFQNFEYALAGADGKIRHLRINGKPVYAADGNFLGYRGTSSDLTAEVEAHKQAERLDQRLRDAVEGMPHGVAMFDAEDRLVFYNSKYKIIYPNIAHLMVLGRTFEEILRAATDTGTFAIDGDREAFIQRRMKAHRERSRDPLQQQQNDGRWVQISEMDTTEGGTVTSWTDITQIKRHEQALALLVEGSASEESFLDAAVKALAFGLGYRWAGVSRFRSDGVAKVLAMWDTDGPGELFEYALADTPCAEIAGGKDYCFYADRVAECFPRDTLLSEMGAASYRGQAIRDAGGRLVGHVFALNDRPDSVETEQHELMSIVARWVGIAIQQQKSEEALRDNETRFRDFAESASDWFWETDMDQRFTYYSASGQIEHVWKTIGGESDSPIGKRRQDLWG